jgi:hypothetical protein
MYRVPSCLREASCRTVTEQEGSVSVLASAGHHFVDHVPLLAQDLVDLVVSSC